MIFKVLLIRLNACLSAIEFARDMTIEEAWAKCERGDWMLWLYQKLHPDNIREITLAKGHCANTVRYLMKDERSIKAVDTAIAFGEGKATREELGAAAVIAADVATDAAVIAAADAATDAAAYAAAYSAAYVAYGAAYVAYAAAVAAAAAKKKNQKETADICRKYLQCPKIN